MREYLFNEMELWRNNIQFADHARHEMSFRAADKLIFTRFGGRSEGCGGTLSWLYLNFPEDIAFVFIAEVFTNCFTELHDHELMDYCAIIFGIDSNLLTSWDGKCVRGKCKFRKIHINGIGCATTATGRQNKYHHEQKNEQRFFHAISPFLIFRVKIVYIFSSQFTSGNFQILPSKFAPIWLHSKHNNFSPLLVQKGNSMTTLTQKTSQASYWQYALWLALFTVFYNIVEGAVSIFFGVSDEALTLFGFGVDSFIEVMSGIGILAMVIRIRQNPDAPRSRFEVTALRVTGTAFYLLAVGLGATAIYNLFTAHKPTTTLPGLIISVVSIAVMWAACCEQTKSWACAQFRSHSFRCELHAGLHLYVSDPAGFQFSL